MPVPTPTMPGAKAAELKYRGAALAQLRILKQQMALGGLKIGQRRVDLGDGVECFCNICFNTEEVYVRVPEIGEVEILVSGFISTPRLFGVNDGYTPELASQGDGSLDYPLDDSTATSQVITQVDGKLVPTRLVHLYGNIDWIGPPSTTVAAKVLSWKGPTGRSVPFDYLVEVPGLTTSDISFGGGNYFTCFGPNIYTSGYIFATAPTVGDVTPKVLGCALQGATLVCVINNHYESLTGFFDEVWINKGSAGLYDATTNPSGWEKIYSTGAGRPRQCWFFNVSGTKCTQEERELSIDLQLKSVALTVHDDGGGSYVAETEGDVTTITHFGAYRLYSDYQGDTRVTATINVSDTSLRTRTTSSAGTTIDADVYISGIQPEFTAYITGPDSWPGTFGIAGSWGACCEGEETTVEPSGCGMSTLSHTYCGHTISKQVRMPNGYWVLQSSEIARCSWPGIFPSYIPCETQPCTHWTIPAQVGCGYSWVSWESMGYPSPGGAADGLYAQEYSPTPEGSSKTVNVWRWAAGAGESTISSLGSVMIGTQNWVCLERHTYEWWCTPTTKGW